MWFNRCVCVFWLREHEVEMLSVRIELDAPLGMREHGRIGLAELSSADRASGNFSAEMPRKSSS